MENNDEKFMLISMDDEKSKSLAEAIGNKTCKKITTLLAETQKKELSETDIADELSLPVNTVEYNLKKLVEAGLVEKSKNFFWSRKGKKIPMYKLSKKLVIIAPKNTSKTLLKSLLPVSLVSILGAVFIKLYFSISAGGRGAINDVSEKVFDVATEEAPAAVGAIVPEMTKTVAYGAASNYWLFFLLGALVALLALLLINWRKS